MSNFLGVSSQHFARTFPNSQESRYLFRSTRLLALLLSFLPIALFARSPIVELSESGTDPGSSTPVNPPVSVPLPRYHELSVYSGRRSDTR